VVVELAYPLPTLSPLPPPFPLPPLPPPLPPPLSPLPPVYTHVHRAGCSQDPLVEQVQPTRVFRKELASGLAANPVTFPVTVEGQVETPPMYVQRPVWGVYVGCVGCVGCVVCAMESPVRVWGTLSRPSHHFCGKLCYSTLHPLSPVLAESPRIWHVSRARQRVSLWFSPNLRAFSPSCSHSHANAHT
jgi:hypothetical protein